MEQHDLKTILKNENISSERRHASQPVWLKLIVGILLFIIFGVMYGISYIFWGGMSQWGGEYNPGVTAPDVYYLLYIWGPILLVLLIAPTVLTFTNIRWLWKIIFWGLSLVLALASWMVWFVIIEVTSK